MKKMVIKLVSLVGGTAARKADDHKKGGQVYEERSRRKIESRPGRIKSAERDDIADF